MAAPRQRPSVQTEVLEIGNVAFFYRPIRGVNQPQTSDDLEHAFLVLFPDDQQRHQNRILTFLAGYFPPIIPNLDLPEEREWAYVSTVTPDPRQVVKALEDGPSGTPPARLAGDGRYLLVRRNGQSYFAYGLRRPKRLGHAQQTLMMELQASFRVVVQEPYVPTPLCLAEKPSYPPELADRFDGHVAIPLDTSDYLDYQWTQLLFISDRTDPEAEFGIEIRREVVNQPEAEALEAVEAIAAQVQPRTKVDILKPAIDGALV